jgi:dihydromethanopterin reductase (acceptor)
MPHPDPSAEERELEALLTGELPPESARRYAWVFTGSGHYLRESLDLALGLETVDFFLSRAAEEVLPMYGWHLAALKERLGGRGRVLRETNYSSVPVGLLYRGFYHTVVVGPATSNTVAKCVVGLSDTLATNMYAQAGKCRVDSIVFACDTEPVVVTDAPNKRVVLYPRRIDLENTERLRGFEYTTVVATPDELAAALDRRTTWLKQSSREFSS